MISYSFHSVAQIINVGYIQGCQTNILELVGKKLIPSSTLLEAPTLPANNKDSS